MTVELDAATENADGSVDTMYTLRYGAYRATLVVESGDETIRALNFWFPEGEAHRDLVGERVLKDYLAVFHAAEMFLENKEADIIIGIVADLSYNIISAIDGEPVREWIWQGGVGFYGTYLPDADSVLMVIRVRD